MAFSTIEIVARLRTTHSVSSLVHEVRNGTYKERKKAQ